MDWFYTLFTGSGVAQSIFVLALTASLGLVIGNVRIRGVGLGIAGTLFSGILLAHAGMTADPVVMGFAQDFGLVLFVYTIGMQAGPGFFDSLKRQGLTLNLLAVAIITFGIAVTVAFHALGILSAPAALGLFAGATTNTPCLAAAQQALGLSPRFTAEAARLAGLGYAVTYPFGILGVILTMGIIRLFFRVSPTEEATAFSREREEEIRNVVSRSIIVEDKDMDGTRVKDIPGFGGFGVVITRLLRGDHMGTADEDTVLRRGDILQAVGKKGGVDAFIAAVGRSSEIDLRSLPGDLVTRRIVVTRRGIPGSSIGSLMLHDRFGVVVGRVIRGDFNFAGTPNIRLNFADKLVVVGTEDGIAAAAESLGDSLEALDHPQVLSVFVGILLGVAVGAVPFRLPGVPAAVKLGTAGGPLLMAIFLSRIGRVGRLNFFISQSANLMLREIGIILFLSCVGLSAGEGFFAVLLKGPGLAWIGYGALLTMVPVLTVGFSARAFLKLNYLSLCGLLSGAMTDPPALAFANTQTPSDAPSIAYATVYPLTMVLRVLSAQLMAIFLFR